MNQSLSNTYLHSVFSAKKITPIINVAIRILKPQNTIRRKKNTILNYLYDYRV